MARALALGEQAPGPWRAGHVMAEIHVPVGAVAVEPPVRAVERIAQAGVARDQRRVEPATADADAIEQQAGVQRRLQPPRLRDIARRFGGSADGDLLDAVLDALALDAQADPAGSAEVADRLQLQQPAL